MVNIESSRRRNDEEVSYRSCFRSRGPGGPLSQDPLPVRSLYRDLHQ